MGRRVLQSSAEEGTYMTNKHMKTYTKSLAIKDMQIKTTIRHSYTLSRMVKNEKDWQYQVQLGV